MRKIAILPLAALCSLSAFARSPENPSDPAEKSQVRVSGSVTAGGLKVDNSTNSAKLTEYRDLGGDFVVPMLGFSLADPGSGWGFALSAANPSRKDQTILARTGIPGIWTVQADWTGIPHDFSHKAKSPYIDRGNGLFTVPGTAPITFKKLATAAADTPGVLASDDLIAAYQAAFLAPIPLGTQTNAGRFAASWSPAAAFTLGVSYDVRDKEGSKSSFGPIGDRPPRTLNIQIAEPVDYRTTDLAFSVEHQGKGYQVRAEVLASSFANGIDTLTWQNIYATAAPGADYDIWDRNVSTFGRRPLPPDNAYRNLTVNGGLDLPLDSRLILTFFTGRLEQDARLLPYAYGDSALANRALPRGSAEATMKTTHAAAEYVIAPSRGLTIRAFLRRYVLTNGTPSDPWQYVTQDVYNTSGAVAYVNKRINLPAAWSRLNAGAEATLRLAKRNTLTVSFEHEGRELDHREADTRENILRASWRFRPASWLSLEARALYGGRNGSDYHNTVTHEGYWYTAADSPDANNPGVTFDNHPDMRRFDVIDRVRRQVDLRVNLIPKGFFSVSAHVRYGADDFDAGVGPSQPLAGTGLADQDAVSPGNQLGLLKKGRLRFGADLFFLPTPGITLSAFLSRDDGTSLMKSLEYNENNKQNPSAIATADLGPWTRASSQWTADTADKTWNAGLQASIQLSRSGAALAADYMMSLADVDIVYDGYGVRNWNGTPFPANHAFAFSTPPTIQENLHSLNIRFEIPVKTATLILGYAYESYRLEDWQQGPSASTPWVEAVGAETLLRDTSRSFQWGNRLFNLGTYLAPSYDAHIGFVGIRCRF